MPEETPNQSFDLTSQKIGVPDDISGKQEQTQETAQEPASQTAQEPAQSLPAASEPVQQQTETEKGGFHHLVQSSFGILWKKKFSFLLLSIVNILVIAAIQILGIPLLFIAVLTMGKYAMMAIMVLIYGLAALISYFFAGTIASLASAAYAGQSAKIGESLSLSVKKTGKAISLFFRVIFYSGIWLALVIAALFALLPLITGYLNLGTSEPFTLFIVNIVLGAAAAVISIVASIRLVYASIAFPKLMSQEFVSAKDAIEYSKTYTKGKWWMIVSSITCFSLLLGMLTLLINITTKMMPDAVPGIVILVIEILTALLAYPLMLIFMQVLMHELGSPARYYRANPWLVTLTLLIYLTPAIVLGGTTFLAYKSINMMSLQNQSITPVFEYNSLNDTQQTQIVIPDATTQAVKTPKVKRQ
jgi:MFS family permease